MGKRSQSDFLAGVPASSLRVLKFESITEDLPRFFEEFGLDPTVFLQKRDIVESQEKPALTEMAKTYVEHAFHADFLRFGYPMTTSRISSTG